MLILGIESSCDETGVALYDTDKGLIADALHTQIEMHRLYGGVVPELASRDHIRRIIPLLNEVMKKAGKTPQDLDAVAVTEGPGLAGALLVGNSVAYGIGLALDIPVVGLDMMVPAADQPDYVFIEANERAGLANHEPQPTAERFIDLLFPHSQPAP